MAQDSKNSDARPTLFDQFAMAALAGIYSARRDTARAERVVTCRARQQRWQLRPLKQ